MTMLPAKCPECLGLRDDCEKCGGSGFVALTLPSGPIYTRKCPDCGWTNGAYFPQPGDWIPTPGQPLRETRDRCADFCMECPRGPDGRHRSGHMVWERIE